MKKRLASVLVVLAASSIGASADDGEALREAARLGDLARVRALLGSGVRADSEGRHGITSLMLAAAEGHLDIARSSRRART